MIKKYFKYIISSFLFMFIGISAVDATDCQYEIPTPDGGYAYVRFNYNGQMEIGNGTRYHCYSKTKLNSLCTEKVEKGFTTNHDIGQEYKIKLYVDSNTYDDLNNNTCPKLSYSIIDNRDAWIDKYYQISLEDNYKSQSRDDYKELNAQASTSTGKIIDDICYETGLNVSGLGNYYFYFCTKTNGDKYWQIKKETPSGTTKIPETKTCNYNEEYIYQTTVKGFTCEYSDESAIEDLVYFNILSEEADKMWAGNFNSLRVEALESEYYITYKSNKELKKNVGVIVVVKDDDPTGKYESLKDLCNDLNVKQVLKAVGYIVVVIKILIPIALIVLGAINFSKAVISGKDDDTKKAAFGMMWGFIAAVVIFVLPTIINFAIGLIDNATDGTDDYKDCRICIFEPGRCK